MVLDVLDKLATEASKILKSEGTMTMNPRTIKAAVRLVAYPVLSSPFNPLPPPFRFCFPGELASLALQEADKALALARGDDGAEA